MSQKNWTTDCDQCWLIFTARCSAVLAVDILCPFVRSSERRVHSDKTKESMILIHRERPIPLVFLHKQRLGGGASSRLPPEIVVQSYPFKNTELTDLQCVSHRLIRASENSSVFTARMSTMSFQRAQDEVCLLPQVPQNVAHNANVLVCE